MIYVVTLLPVGHYIASNNIDIDSDELGDFELGKEILELSVDSYRFFNKFKSIAKKNNYNDLVDECNALIYPGHETKKLDAVQIQTKNKFVYQVLCTK